ncbi:MAG: protein kinase domain-containing protein [Thermoguttaceae bacterium]
MPVPSAESTGAFDVSRVVPTAHFAPGSGVPPSGFDEELRPLLRWRLLLVHVLSLALVFLLAVMIRLTPAAEQEGIVQPRESYFWARLAAQFAEAAIGTLALWRFSGMTLRSLRLWELTFLVTYAAAAGLNRFEALAAPLQGAAESVPALAIGFSDLTSLQGFIILILAYGVLIPNTPRRSLLVVAVLTAVPLAIIPAAVVANPSLRAGRALGLFIQSALCLTYPAAIAVFAAARAVALQRRAFEAERKAEQLDQYALKRKLGEGAMGEVWLAEHRLLKRPCAVKFIRPELAAHPAIAARFAREVHAVTGLTHPNTVRVYDYGRTTDSSFYFVMEYLDGPTLEELVRQSGPLLPARAAYLLQQLCGALAEAHAAGLVHRDLKPSNVIVATLGGQRDVAKLLDFGLVQDLSSDTEDRLTRAGTVLGSPAYMSPEQAAGESVVDARGDVYGLGAVAFFALTGRPPFAGKTFGQLLAAHRSEPPPPLTDFRRDVPADLSAVVARCLAKDREDRFPSAAALGRALGECRCAADWSSERAAEWWNAKTGGGTSLGAEQPSAVH